MVPLATTHRSGRWKWTSQQKEDYYQNRLVDSRINGGDARGPIPRRGLRSTVLDKRLDDGFDRLTGRRELMP